MVSLPNTTVHGDAKQKTNLGKRQFSILVMMKKGKIRKEDLQKPVTLGYSLNLPKKYCCHG